MTGTIRRLGQAAGLAWYGMHGLNWEGKYVATFCGHDQSIDEPRCSKGQSSLGSLLFFTVVTSSGAHEDNK